MLLIAANKSPLPHGELVLDAENPVLMVELNGIPMRLRVDLGRYDSIELNPYAAAKLPARWESGATMLVGRVEIPSRVAPVSAKAAGLSFPSQVIDHGRECCVGVDGAIGPNLLPFAVVRWRRAGVFGNLLSTVAMPLEMSDETGLSAPAGSAKNVRIRFTLDQPVTTATASAGAILSGLWAGRW
ncbi:MAG TPA: hypothetical protein VNT42_01205, partial [Sphingomonas sp.]|nr:hypothetical protein [Sphingomonas sp.]